MTTASHAVSPGSNPGPRIFQIRHSLGYQKFNWLMFQLTTSGQRPTVVVGYGPSSTGPEVRDVDP